jgi:hypothetical protein
MDDLELVHQMLSVDWKTALLAKLLRTSWIQERESGMHEPCVMDLGTNL